VNLGGLREVLPLPHTQHSSIEGQAEGRLDILHLYKDYYPILGGIENHIKMLAEAQAAAGHTVRVLVTNPGRLARREVLHGVQIERVPRLATVASTPLTLSFFPALARARADITHLHFPYPVGEISQFLAGRRPFVITYHSDVIRASQQVFLRGYTPLMKHVLDRAARILVTSEAYARTSPILQSMGNRCALAPLGVDPVPFQAAAPWQPRPLEAPVTALFVGRHRYYKGVADLIRALPHTTVNLLVGGDGPLRQEWQALAAELGLQRRVCFLGDIADQDLPGVYASADMFVLPANLRSEAFGTVLLEAMAAGLPCIATELGTGTSYVVQHGVSGLVTPPNDPLALAGAINQLAADRQLRHHMGAAGQARVMAEFTREHMVEKVMQIYTTVINSQEYT
jgi:glycosyltransferase involved in cell wall biosynthesis